MYKVIIADDEKWDALLVRKLIEQSGQPFEVQAIASNGIEAMEYVVEYEPDLLFADIRMPSMDGLELIEKINACNLNIRVVFVSGYAEFEYARRALRSGATDYLLKPVANDKLSAILRKVKEELDKERNSDAQEKDDIRNVFRRSAAEEVPAPAGEPEDKEGENRCYICAALRSGASAGFRQGWMPLNDYLSVRTLQSGSLELVFAEGTGTGALDGTRDREFRHFLRSRCLNTAIGVSRVFSSGEAVEEMIGQAMIALYTEWFREGTLLLGFEDRRGEGRELLRNYLVRVSAISGKESADRCRVILADMENDVRAEKLYIDQLALLYDHIVIGCFRSADSDLYDYRQLFEQFRTEDRLFRFMNERLMSEYGEDDHATNSLLYSLVTQVREMKELKDISLRTLSAQYGLSMGYMSTILKKELGVSFSDYLTQKRIERAKELLLNDQLSLEYIAEQIGYADYFYFLKMFKKQVGISPSTYRRTMLGI